MPVSITNFGEGKLFTLSMPSLTINVAEYGATLARVLYTTNRGESRDLVLGFDEFDDYITNQSSYFGACVGRVANRIKEGHSMPIGLENCNPTANEGTTSLHGGKLGFSKVYFKGEIIADKADQATVKFTRLSIDGEEGYPGNLEASFIYTITNKNEIILDMKGICDKKTLYSPTHHPYWTLSDDNTIFSHKLRLSEDVRFVNLKEIKDDFDDPFDVNKSRDTKVVAYLESPNGDLSLSITSDRPALQVYTGRFLEGVVARGRTYHKHATVCLEPQHYLHDLNSAVLEADRKFNSTIIYKIDSKE